MADGLISQKNCYVYVLFRADGSPFYVGKGKRNRINGTLYSSLRSGRGKNSYKDRIISQMISRGVDVPRVKVASSVSEAAAFDIERALIAAIGRIPNGPLVNLTDGGEGWSGRRLSEAHKIAFRRPVLKHSPESIERMRKASLGKKGTRVGKKNSPEHNAAISAANLGKDRRNGRPTSDETKAKLSMIFKGRKPSPQTIAARRKQAELARLSKFGAA